MDNSAIVQAAKAAREFVVDVGDGRRVTLQVPSPHQMRVAYVRGGAASGSKVVNNDPAFWPVVLRSLLEQCVIDWSNVTVDDLLHDGNREPSEFHSSLVAILLDAQDAWRAKLDDAMTQRVFDSVIKLKDAEKN